MSAWPAAILFDFDGVLVNSEPLHLLGFQRTLSEVGLPLTEAEYFAELIGFDDRGAFAFVFKKHGRPLDGGTFAALLARKAAIVEAAVRAGEVEALPGVKTLIPQLAERFPLAICSGALREEIEGMLAGIGLRQFFPIIVAAEDVAIGKPDPMGYLMTAKHVGERIGRSLSSADCLIVEDAPSVTASVTTAGFRVLGVTTSYPAAAMKSAGAAWVTDTLEPEALQSLVPELFEKAAR